MSRELIPNFEWHSIAEVTLWGYYEESKLNGQRAKRHIAIITDDMVGRGVPQLGTIFSGDVGGCLVLDLLENDRVEAYIVGTPNSDRSSAPKKPL